MRALRFHAAFDVRLDEVSRPDDPVGREVLLAPVVCGMCGTDVHEYTSGPLRTSVGPHPLTGGCVPQILGHELSAEVVATGPEVSRVAVGERVSVMPLVSCGACRACAQNDSELCSSRASIGLRHPWGGFGDLLLADERQVAPLPDGVDWIQGALIEPLAVGSAAVARSGMVPGDSVLVAGAGPIGAFAAIAAEAAGAGEVLVSEPNPRRAARLAACGFEVIDPSQIDVVGRCLEGGGVDVAIECSGSDAALLAGLRAVRSGGTVALAGLPAGCVALDARDLMLRGIRLVGSVGYPFGSWPRLIEQVSTGKLAPERLVTSRVPLEHAVSDGFERLLDPTTGEVKVLVEMRAA